MFTYTTRLYAACLLGLLSAPAAAQNGQDCRRYTDEIRVGSGMSDTYVTRCADGSIEADPQPQAKGQPDYAVRPQDSRHYPAETPSITGGDGFNGSVYVDGTGRPYTTVNPQTGIYSNPAGYGARGGDAREWDNGERRWDDDRRRGGRDFDRDGRRGDRDFDGRGFGRGFDDDARWDGDRKGKDGFGGRDFDGRDFGGRDRDDWNRDDWDRGRDFKGRDHKWRDDRHGWRDGRGGKHRGENRGFVRQNEWYSGNAGTYGTARFGNGGSVYYYSPYSRRDWSPAKRGFHQHHNNPGWQKHWKHHQRTLTGK